MTWYRIDDRLYVPGPCMKNNSQSTLYILHNQWKKSMNCKLKEKKNTEKNEKYNYQYERGRGPFGPSSNRLAQHVSRSRTS